MAAAQDANLFADEIVPMETKMKQVNKETGEETIVDYVVDRDECNRPQTTLEGLNGLAPVRGDGNFVTAGNASQLSDGAAAVVSWKARKPSAAALSRWVLSGALRLLVVSRMKWASGRYLPCRAFGAPWPERR